MRYIGSVYSDVAAALSTINCPIWYIYILAHRIFEGKLQQECVIAPLILYTLLLNK